MGSYTTIGAPVKIIIPGPRKKSQVELPKIKLQLNKQQNAMVRLPLSTGSVSNSSQSRGSQQQVQKQQQLQQIQQLQQVNVAQPLYQQPQVQPVHLVNQCNQAPVTQDQQEPQEPHHTTEQQEQQQPEKTVTFADVHCDQYGRYSPIHGSVDSGRSTPSQTSSGRSSPVQSIQGDQSTTLIAKDQSTALMARDQSTAVMPRDQSTAVMARRPSITQLIVYQHQQQIVPKPQAHKMIRQPTNKRKASLTNVQPPNMQLSFPIVLSNQQQMMLIPRKQIEYQQCQAPKGYKSARKNSNSGQDIVIKIVIK